LRTKGKRGFGGERAVAKKKGWNESGKEEEGLRERWEANSHEKASGGGRGIRTMIFTRAKT